MKEWCLKNKEYRKEWSLKNPEYHRKYRAENLEKVREATKKWAAANPEKNREAQRKWRAKDPEKAREANTKKNRIWRANNPEKPRASNIKYRANNTEKIKIFRRKWKKYKRETDPNWKLTENMRSAMYSALKGRSKSMKTMKIIGCTGEKLFEHFESCPSWESWMTRENYGRGGWDADHIIPISQWCENCPLQFALCWDKSNLQPLEHIANLKKGGR